MTDAKETPSFAPDFKVSCELCPKQHTKTCARCHSVYYCSVRCASKHASTHQAVCETSLLQQAHEDNRIGFTLHMKSLFDLVSRYRECQSIFEFMKGRSVSLVMKYHKPIAVDSVDELAVETVRVLLCLVRFKFGECRPQDGSLSARYVETGELAHNGKPIDTDKDTRYHVRFEYVDYAKGVSLYTDAFTPYKQPCLPS